MKVLFFSPHAYWAVHAIPEALVAESLALQGCEVVVVNCDGVYRRNCVCMPLVRIDDFEQKAKICVACKSNRDWINEEFGFRNINIDPYVSPSWEQKVEAIIAGTTPESYLNIELDGVPVARYALYEFVLNHKLSSTSIPPEHWEEYLENLKNALRTYAAIKDLIATERPDRITTYNSLYAVNRIVCAVADLYGIPHFTLHAGSHHKRRIQQMTIFRGIENSVLGNQHPVLKTIRNAPLSKDQIEVVSEHVSQLFDATSPWVYTVKSDRVSVAQLRADLGIQASQKVLLAVMRSNDERFGLELAGMHLFDANPVFGSQYEWLDWLVAFARANPEYFIIFRVHPREYPNKRESKLSQNAVRFERHISALQIPANLKINTPDDHLSLHDLLKVTDVVLNGTSSVGLEACLMGIPVVGMSERLYAFDLALQTEAIDILDYELKITEALRHGLDFQRVIAAYRWLNYVFSEVCIDIADGYAAKAPWSHYLKRIGLGLYRRLGGSGPMLSPMWTVRKRAKPLRNAERLCYAIVNDCDSHIGHFPRMMPDDPGAEATDIARHYMRTMKKISSDSDREFWTRVDQCLTKAEALA